MKNLAFEEFHISIDNFTPPHLFQCTQIGENVLLFDGVNFPRKTIIDANDKRFEEFVCERNISLPNYNQDLPENHFLNNNNTFVICHADLHSVGFRPTFPFQRPTKLHSVGFV